MLPPSLSGGVRSCSSFTSQASREDQPQEADGTEMAEEVITAPLWGPGASETLSGGRETAPVQLSGPLAEGLHHDSDPSASRPLHIRPRRTWRGGGAPSCVGSALGDISMTLQGVQPAAGAAAASPSPTGSPFGILWLFMPLASGLGLRARSLGGACPESPPFPASGLPEPQLAGHPCAPHTCRGDPISSSRKSFL